MGSGSEGQPFPWVFQEKDGCGVAEKACFLRLLLFGYLPSTELKPQSHWQAVISLPERITMKGKCNIMCKEPGTKVRYTDHHKASRIRRGFSRRDGLGRVWFALVAGHWNGWKEQLEQRLGGPWLNRSRK